MKKSKKNISPPKAASPKPPRKVKAPLVRHVPLVAFSVIAVLIGLTWYVAGISKPLPRFYAYQVVAEYPHDPTAFTEGLLFNNGFLYESTGLNGRSSLRKVDLTTGRTEKSSLVPNEFFAEGLALWDRKLIQLTYKSHVAFVYEKETFNKIGEFHYDTEGWGLTQDGTNLIMSDGSSNLRFLDPKSFAVVRTLAVTDLGTPVENLNELEYVKGEIFANVWKSNRIARISPRDGKVNGWIDLEGLLPQTEGAKTDVLNGIAYDSEKDRLFVTGKLWPHLYEIKLFEK